MTSLDLRSLAVGMAAGISAVLWLVFYRLATHQPTGL